MQPVFQTEHLSVYCLRDTDQENLPVDIYFGLWDSLRQIVVHASLEKQTNGDSIIETIGVTREFEEIDCGEYLPPLEPLLEFCRGLEDHNKDGHVLLYPCDERSEALLKEWRPDHYAMHCEKRRIDPLLNHEMLAGLRGKYPHPDASQN